MGTMPCPHSTMWPAREAAAERAQLAAESQDEAARVRADEMARDPAYLADYAFANIALGAAANDIAARDMAHFFAGQVRAGIVPQSIVDAIAESLVSVAAGEIAGSLQ